jgi:hypothetical protein
MAAGDPLIVPSLDRLSRSLQDLITTVGDLRRRGIGFTSLHESLDTTTPGGRLVFHVFAALAEFIRELIASGTREGLAAARARGRVGGRPTVVTPEIIRAARDMLGSPYHPAQKRRLASRSGNGAGGGPSKSEGQWPTLAAIRGRASACRVPSRRRGHLDRGADLRWTLEKLIGDRRGSAGRSAGQVGAAGLGLRRHSSLPTAATISPTRSTWCRPESSR